MTNHSKEFTLRGYLEIIRRQWWLVLIVGVIAAAGAAAYTKLQNKSYSATSTLTVNDPGQDAALAGGSSFFSGKTPLQEATIASQQVTRDEVTKGVEKKLHTSSLGSVST